MKRYRSVRLLSAAVLLIPFLAGSSQAVCNVSATGLSFGPYDDFSPVPLDSTGTVSVACDEAPPPDVVISIGPSGNGSMNPRAMRHASLPDLLRYNLFLDASRGAVWGDGTAGTQTVTLFVKNVTKNKPRTATIYGRIEAGQSVSMGPYSDTLTVTITW